MRRGIVLARSGRTATVLVDGGEFVRVPAQGWAIGDEVSLPERLPERLRRRSMRAYGYAAGALAGVLALLPVLIPAASAQVVAYASVDINPSIELGLSASGQVLTTSAIDRDGRALLRTVDVEGKTLPQAVTTLLNAAASQGYLRKTRDVSVILAEYPAGSAHLPASMEEGLRGARTDAAAFAASHHYNGVVSALIAPSWVRTAATQKHVSVGLYAVWTALHSANIKVSLRSLQGRTLGQEIAGVEKNVKGSEVLKLLSGTTAVGVAKAAGSGGGQGHKGQSGSSENPSGVSVPEQGSTKPSTGSGPAPSTEGTNGTSGTSGTGHSQSTNSEGQRGSEHGNSSSQGGSGTQGKTQLPIIIVTPNSQIQVSYPNSEDGHSGGRSSGDGSGPSQSDHGHPSHGPKGDHHSGGDKGHGQSFHTGTAQTQGFGQAQGTQGTGGQQSGSGIYWNGFGQLNLPGSGGSGDGSSTGTSSGWSSGWSDTGSSTSNSSGSGDGGGGGGD